MLAGLPEAAQLLISDYMWHTTRCSYQFLPIARAKAKQGGGEDGLNGDFMVVIMFGAYCCVEKNRKKRWTKPNQRCLHFPWEKTNKKK